MTTEFKESPEKVVLAGLGALQGEFLQDEPRLRGLNYCYSIPERVGRALNPPDFCTFSETSQKMIDISLIFLTFKNN